jgi:hypothetical protein
MQPPWWGLLWQVTWMRYRRQRRGRVAACSSVPLVDVYGRGGGSSGWPCWHGAMHCMWFWVTGNKACYTYMPYMCWWQVVNLFLSLVVVHWTYPDRSRI